MKRPISCSDEKDRYYLKKALLLSKEAKGKTFPNPAVGAVIVKNGMIVGLGSTQKYGGAHAEKVALMQAGENAKDATLYVTLEPCCHSGKKTPPCTDAVIAAGIRRVVISVLDPNPRVFGKGVEQLQKAGIEVSVGLFEKEASIINEDFFWSITKKRAWVTLKLAMTLDGRIADESNSSKWITGDKSRRFVHELRRCHAAVAVGRTTFEVDDPQLTVRHKKGYYPARIIFTSDERISTESYFYKHTHEARSIVVILGGEKRTIIKAESGIEFWYTGNCSQQDKLNSFLEIACEEGITSVFIEGGQRIASSFLEAGLVNRIYFFYGNKLLGNGKDGILFTSGLPMKNCISLKEMGFKKIGDDIVITGKPEFSLNCG